MSKRPLELFLFDIYIAILKIKHTATRFDNAQRLLYDFNAWDSVIREFEIIGEATNKLIKERLLTNDFQVVVDFRNQLIHHYFGIDAEQVWNIIVDDLPEFESQILYHIRRIPQALKADLIKDFTTHYHYLPFIREALESL